MTTTAPAKPTIRSARVSSFRRFAGTVSVSTDAFIADLTVDERFDLAQVGIQAARDELPVPVKMLNVRVIGEHVMLVDFMHGELAR